MTCCLNFCCSLLGFNFLSHRKISRRTTTSECEKVGYFLFILPVRVQVALLTSVYCRPPCYSMSVTQWEQTISSFYSSPHGWICSTWSAVSEHWNNTLGFPITFAMGICSCVSLPFLSILGRPCANEQFLTLCLSPPAEFYNFWVFSFGCFKFQLSCCSFTTNFAGKLMRTRSDIGPPWC